MNETSLYMLGSFVTFLLIVSNFIAIRSVTEPRRRRLLINIFSVAMILMFAHLYLSK